MVSVGRTFDLVVTSGGGAPLDRTFYQTVKGMVAVLPLLHRGSRLLIASGCAAGIGSREYRELLFRYRGDYRSFIRDCKSADRVLRDQWEYQMQCKVLQKVGVEGIRLLSDGIPLAQQRLVSLLPCEFGRAGPAEGLQRAFDELSAGVSPRSIAIVPQGPYLVLR